jgi:aquaporin Z
VSLAFAVRGNFPWRRVPGYIVVQLGGATLAALFLRAVIDASAKYGSDYPPSGYSNMAAFCTASGAQNIGIIGAFGVGGYIASAGLWGSPISGASMNPARTFGPDLVGRDWTAYWVYVAGPVAGAVAAAVVAFVPRDHGGQGRAGRRSRRSVHRSRPPRQGLNEATDRLRAVVAAQSGGQPR